MLFCAHVGLIRNNGLVSKDVLSSWLAGVISTASDGPKCARGQQYFPCIDEVNVCETAKMSTSSADMYAGNRSVIDGLGVDSN